MPAPPRAISSAPSPSWLLGRLLRNIDIRTVGFHNAGVRNIKATLGLWPAAVAACIDTSKGIGAILLAEQGFGLPAAFAALPAAAAVAGHIFPFYLGFRGGKGTATAIGGGLMTAYVLSYFLPVPLLFILLGAVFAAIVELFSDLLDDNFSVSLLTGSLLFSLRFFLMI